MLFNLLTDTNTGTEQAAGGDWVTWVILIAMIALFVVYFVFSSRSNKKKQEEAMQIINAVKPGNKVKTIGGICGIVVEVDNEENTFVLETGSEASGKSYMKFDKQAIYQTDAVAETKESSADQIEEEVEEEAEEAEDKE